MNIGIPELVVLGGAAILCLMVVAGVIALGLWVIRTRSGGDSGEGS